MSSMKILLNELLMEIRCAKMSPMIETLPHNYQHLEKAERLAMVLLEGQRRIENGV